MNKRPDQHNLDQNEAGATDYKFRRQTQDQVDRATPDQADRATSQTPNEAMESRRQQSERDREKELERAAEVKERGEGNHDSNEAEGEGGDRSETRRTGAGQPNRDAVRDTAEGTGRDGASARMGRGGGEMNVESGRARTEREERVQRDREEMGRQSLETQGRSMEDAVQQRRAREAEENERR